MQNDSPRTRIQLALAWIQSWFSTRRPHRSANNGRSHRVHSPSAYSSCYCLAFYTWLFSRTSLVRSLSALCICTPSTRHPPACNARSKQTIHASIKRSFLDPVPAAIEPMRRMELNASHFGPGLGGGELSFVFHIHTSRSALIGFPLILRIALTLHSPEYPSDKSHKIDCPVWVSFSAGIFGLWQMRQSHSECMCVCVMVCLFERRQLYAWLKAEPLGSYMFTNCKQIVCPDLIAIFVTAFRFPVCTQLRREYLFSFFWWKSG